MMENKDIMEHDYHGHPNYVAVFGSLVVLFAISVVADMMKESLGNTLALTIIFVTAFAKAFLVMANFMHLKFEPMKFLWLPLFTVFVLFVFLTLIYPDVSMVQLIVSKW